MFKKDNFLYGALLGLLFPMIGLIIFKLYKFESFTFKNTFLYMVQEIGHKTLTVALSLSLILNALLFTIFINRHVDRTAKGVFLTTVLFGIAILLIKLFG